MKNKNRWAFTLVELIVVITILAILWTIAFISLQWYSRDARNSTRLSDMNSVETSLELFSLQTGYYPTPDSFSEVTLSSGTVHLWKQWELWEWVYGLISRLSHLPVDPLNGENMEYSVTDKKKEYELKYDMEISQNTRVSMSYAAQKSANITWVYNGLYLLGSDGVYYAVPSLFSDTGSLDSPADFQFTNKTVNFQVVPLSYSWTTVTSSNLKENYTTFWLGLQKAYSWSVDLNEQRFETVKNFTESSAEAYAKAIFEGKVSSSSQWENIALNWWRLLDPNCEIDDILFDFDDDGNPDQVWAGCNSTLWDGFEWWKLENNTNGAISSCFPNYNGVSDTANCDASNEQLKSNSKANSWFSGTNSNGDKEYNTIWGKLYTWEQATWNNGNVWACPSGWKIPSNSDWLALESHLWCVDYLSGSRRCEGLWWNSVNQTKNRALTNNLLIPLSGYRSTNNTSFSHRGEATWIWSSDISSGLNVYYRSISRWESRIDYSNNSRYYGFSARCIKDI